MLIATKDKFILTESGTLCTEASTLELAPGEWPDFISVVDEEGEGFLFQKVHVDEMGGSYQTKGGALLMVWND